MLRILAAVFILLIVPATATLTCMPSSPDADLSRTQEVDLDSVRFLADTLMIGDTLSATVFFTLGDTDCHKYHQLEIKTSGNTKEILVQEELFTNRVCIQKNISYTKTFQVPFVDTGDYTILANILDSAAIEQRVRVNERYLVEVLRIDSMNLVEDTISVDDTLKVHVYYTIGDTSCRCFHTGEVWIPGQEGEKTVFVSLQQRYYENRLCSGTPPVPEDTILGLVIQGPGNYAVEAWQNEIPVHGCSLHVAE